MNQLSRHTIAEYLPEIKGICASIEVEMAKHDLDSLTELRPFPAIEQYGQSKVIYAMMLVNEWLKGTPFKTHAYFLQKTNRDAKWADMLNVLKAKVLEYQNDVPMFVLSLSRSGRITRTVDGTVLDHDFESEGFKKEILMALLENDGYVSTNELKRRTGSKSIESVSKTIAAINNVLKTKLQLPPKAKVIESKRGSGYRLNSLYNTVLTN